MDTRNAPIGAYELVVFDWDGTILDTTAAITRALQFACRSCGLPEPSDETARSIIGLDWRAGLAVAAPGLYHAGVAASGDGQRFTGFDLTVFLWKKASPGDPAHYFVVEESGDNQHYSPVELEVKSDVPGEFNCFRLVPRNGLKRNTAYLRFGIRADSVQTSWAAQIGQVRLDK